MRPLLKVDSKGYCVMSFESDSLYSQFDEYEAPQPTTTSNIGQHANRKDMTKPYVNVAPKHVQEAMASEQKDESSNGFWRMFTKQIPKGTFEQSVNMAFGGKPEGEFNYMKEKQRYIDLYRKMMGELT